MVPTVQMVFRRSLQNVRSREDYFSGAAHPAAFEGFEINPARMVSLANSIKADDIPPRVAHQGHRRGPRHRGPRLLRPGPLRAALRHPLGDRPRLAREPLQPDDAGLGRRHHATPTAGRSASSGACCRATPRGCRIEPAADGRQRPHHPRLAGALPHLRGQPAHRLAGRHRRLRQQRRARQRPGDPQLVLPARGGAPLRPRAPTARRASPASTMPPARPPTPTRC